MKRILILLFTSLLYASLTYGKESNVYVVIHSFHSGIVIKKSDISLHYLSNAKSFDDAEYIEIGFGDKKYYMSDKPGIGTGARALLLPTRSVMHVVKIVEPLQQSFPHSEVFKLPLRESQLQLLLKYIENSFLGQQKLISPVGNSLYLQGNFYNGKINFHLFNTCNTWVAKALNHAGFNINPSFVITETALKEEIVKLTK